MYVIVVDPHSTQPSYLTAQGAPSLLKSEAAIFSTADAARKFARRQTGRLRSYQVVPR